MIATLVLLAALSLPPRPADFVTDNAQALSAAASDSIAEELRGFEAATGNQVIVWIGSTTGGVPLEDWTSQAADRWKFGRKGKDNGAILFLFMHDHRARIEVGYGLEPKLTDAKSGEILNAMAPKLRSGDVDGAVRGGVESMLAAIDPAAAAKLAAPATGQAANDDDDTGEGIAALVVFLIFLGVIFCVIVTIVRRGKKHGDWMDMFLMSSAMGPASGFGGHGFGGGGGGGFSAGGGGFGGGGASGSW